jgi:hypothetical protein
MTSCFVQRGTASAVIGTEHFKWKGVAGDMGDPELPLKLWR